MMRITIPVATVSEANRRDHWSLKAKRAKGHRKAAFWALQAEVASKVVPDSVTMTRVAPRPLDDDNLRSALKAVRDGIADYFGINDRDPRVTWRYGQERGEVRQNYVVVVIEP